MHDNDVNGDDSAIAIALTMTFFQLERNVLCVLCNGWLLLFLIYAGLPAQQHNMLKSSVVAATINEWNVPTPP